MASKAIFSGGAACVGGELVINVPTILIYDGTQLNIIGHQPSETVSRRASVYVYTAWDPTDVAGTLTNASGTSSATSTATSYITVANSSGTTTWTCVRPGVYRFTITMVNETATTSTLLYTPCVIGGTATVLLGTATTITPINAGQGTDSGSNDLCGTSTFYAVMTAAQTVTILPKVAVVSGGATTSFTQQCTVSAEYTGT